MVEASRRRFVRWFISQQAKLKLEGSHTDAVCQIMDISLKGMQVALLLKVEQDKFVKLRLVLSDECVLNLEVWVIWHRMVERVNLYGFYFTKIRDVDKEKIYQYIQRNFPDQITQRWWRDTTLEKGGSMEDRRVFARFPTKISLRYLDLKENQEGEGVTCDFSAKGIGLLTDKQLKPSAPLEVWLKMPDKGEPLYTRGTVAWLSPVSEHQWRAGVSLEKAELMGFSRALREA